jgi:hypothetical protein
MFTGGRALTHAVSPETTWQYWIVEKLSKVVAVRSITYIDYENRGRDIRQRDPRQRVSSFEDRVTYLSLQVDLGRAKSEDRQW